MIQLVINTSLLRELDEEKLIYTYAKFIYNDDEDISNEVKIRENLVQLLDWDKNGDKGLGIYCSKFEGIKRKDWDKLTHLIINYKLEIKRLAEGRRKRKILGNTKIILKGNDLKYWKSHERLTSSNYKLTHRGIKAKGCVYNGRYYKSRLECIHKEEITKNELYKYLYKSHQLDPNSSLYQKFKRQNTVESEKTNTN